MKINLDKIKEKLSDFDFDSTARLTGFCQSTAQKISPFYFVVSFLSSLGQEELSLSGWADEMMRVCGISVSKQALDKRTSGHRHVDFTEAFLGWAFKKASVAWQKQTRKCLEQSPFSRILIQDSCCLSLGEGCADQFPGSHSKTGTAATAKIQLVMDLKNDQVIDLDVTNFRKNDQGDAGRILEMVQPNDLVLRDLGYFVLRIFEQINAKGAYYLSRLQRKVHLFDLISEERIDLLKLCRSKQRNGIQQFDLPVKVGESLRLKTRLIVTELSQAQYQKRRRKALKNRSVTANHSNEYLDLLRWQFLITNASKEQLSIGKAVETYRLRWRIEIVFKCWKSGMKMQKMFSSILRMKATRAQIMIYLFLSYLLLFCFRRFHQLKELVSEKYGQSISLMKWFAWVSKSCLAQMCTEFTPEQIKHLARSCRYDRRKRSDHDDLMAQISSG